MNVFFDVLIKKFTYALQNSLIYNSGYKTVYIMVNLPTLSTSHIGNSHFVNFDQMELTKWELTKWEVGQVGIDEMGIDKMGINLLALVST